MLPALNEIIDASAVVYEQMPATPQYQWAQLNRRIGIDLWLKHENHTPLGAFKVRGGIVYFKSMVSRIKQAAGVICATRGNHGQSIARAATQHGVSSTIVVPHGNSREKNAAMQSQGARLIEHGSDFQEAFEHATELSQRDDLHMIPSFHRLLIEGVATYSLELFRAVPNLDVLYVPIGLGSGICGAIATRNAMSCRTEIVGVVSTSAPAYAKSFAAKRSIESLVNTRIADGMACRKPNEESLQHILHNVSRVVQVSDDQVEQAMRDIYECTHNVAEGAGAASLAAATMEADQLQGKRVAAVLCGGNVDRDVFARVLAANPG